LKSAPPPAKPCWRISRTRLSRQWFTPKRIDVTSVRHGQVRNPKPAGYGPRARAVPRREGRQQSVWPGVVVQLSRCCHRGLSVRASQAARGGRAFAGGLFHGSGPIDSTSLHPFAPPELPGFDATMGALTPARRLFVSLSGTMNSAWTRAGLPVSCVWPSRPFRLQPPSRPRDRFCTLPLSVTDFRIAPVRASPFPSRLAARQGRIEFTCVADWSFTSRCSPPRLAATQLRSVTGRRVRA